jgi:DNA-binding MarR family transcriptional regulator
MTESWSEFLSPERAELRANKTSGQDARATMNALSRAILMTLSMKGPLEIADLLTSIKARPREIVSTVDELETRGYVFVRVDGLTENVALTTAGNLAAGSTGRTET